MVDLVHNAGIRIRELEAEVARLKRRLEIAHAYDGAGNEIPFPAGMEHLDGIACRDETIRQQDAQIEKLKEEIARLAPAPSRPADREEIAREWWDRTCPRAWAGQWDHMKTADDKLAQELVEETYEDADAILELLARRAPSRPADREEIARIIRAATDALDTLGGRRVPGFYRSTIEEVADQIAALRDAPRNGGDGTQDRQGGGE